MKKSFLLGLLLFAGSSVFCQTAKQVNEVTNKFLSTLNQDQLNIVNYEFKDSTRTKWTNLPVGLAERPGLKYGEFSEESKVYFHHILTTLFSSQVYLKTTSIMHLDDILNIVYETAYKRKTVSKKVYEEIKSLKWAFENYYLSIWGKPNNEEPWGLKFEGHHISINLSIYGDEIRLTPLFLGTDPSEVQITKYSGLRVLSKEEDYAFQLINSLSEEQKKMAILSEEVPQDIITNPNNSDRIMDYKGIKANEMNNNQKDLLNRLIMEYIGNLEIEKSRKAITRIQESGIDEVYFAWIGSLEPKKSHYYNINGPDFLIEYDNANRIGVANHIHTIWREKGKDFGEDILKTHYLNHKH